MELEDTSHSQPRFPSEALLTPHFDDEVTLQTARPVVPLHELKVAARTRSSLLLSAALCVAAILGALSLSLINHYRAPESTTSPATVENPTPSSDSVVFPSGEATGAPLHVNDSPASEKDSPKPDETPGKVEADGRNATRVRQQTARRPQVSKSTNGIASPVIESYDDRVLADEVQASREERREARRLRRERRVDSRRPADDLTRIREIFEGSPRP